MNTYEQIEVIKKGEIIGYITCTRTQWEKVAYIDYVTLSYSEIKKYIESYGIETMRKLQQMDFTPEWN